MTRACPKASVLPDTDGRPPRILSSAQRVELPGVDRDAVLKMLEANETEALYRHLVIALCNALNASLPQMFEPIRDYTELLFPRGLLRGDSVLYEMARKVDPEDWRQIEIIGWLYQYYITEINALVYDGNMSKSRIPKELLPAATQIFTPEWVVQYMVQYSLGRLWLERERTRTGKGEAELAASFGWKYYLPEAEQEPEVEAKLRELREAHKNHSPEDIRLIDPCMGSGHILACTFDVLMQLYRASGYTDRDAVRNIVEKNLFGLDVDDRAAQLAYFTIMMKACEYDPRFLTRGLQPNVCAIQESNSLVAFDRLSGQMNLGLNDLNTANELIETFRDAKEYGSILGVSLLNIGALIGLMGRLEAACLSSLELQKWYESAKDLLPALTKQTYIMAQKYDAVVTNPPYLGSSRMSEKLNAFVVTNYPEGKADLSTVMYTAAMKKYCKESGFLCFITITTWMFLSSFETFRKLVLSAQDIVTLVDFGSELFEGKTGHNLIAAWVACNQHFGGSMQAIRLVDYCYSKRDMKEPEFFEAHNRYAAQQENFLKIPGSPIAYWLSKIALGMFGYRGLSLFTQARIGLVPGNNEIYVRLWHEVPIHSIGMSLSRTEAKMSGNTWFPYNKGGDYRKWFGNRSHIVNWRNDGYEMQTRMSPDGKRIWAHNFNLDFIFKKHIGWSDITSGNLSFRIYEDGFIFDSASNAAFIENEKESMQVLAYLNACIVCDFSKVLNSSMHFKPGDLYNLPYKRDQCQPAISISESNTCLSKQDWDSSESSWDFACHLMTKYRISQNPVRGNDMANYSLENSYESSKEIMDVRFNLLMRNEEELNRIFIDLYGLQDELTPEVADKDVTVYRIIDEPNEEERSMRYVLSKRDAIATFMSYAVGCMMGRYSPYVGGLVLAGQPYEEGFHHNAALRQVSEGEWIEEPGDGVVIVSAKGEKAQAPEGVFLPDRDAILPITDDEYFQDDIVTKFVRFVEAIYGRETREENLRFIADALGTRGDTPREAIRNYYLKEFYKDHLKTYQKRPIYWLYDSGKADGFKALVYLHCYDRDTLARLRTDYVHEQQERLRTQLDIAKKAMEDADPRRRAAATKRAQKLGKQLDEVNRYEEILHHMADMRIALDLDDGVVVNYAKMGELVAKI